MRVKPAILLTLLRGVERLAESILDRADVEILTLYDMTAPFMESRGLPFRPFSSFLTDAARERLTAEAARRAKAVAEGLYGPDLRGQWPDLDDATYEALAAEIMNTLRVSFREEAVLIETLRRCASETDLRLIIVHQDICRDTKTLVCAGRRLGVPTLHIAHGYPYGCQNAISMRDPMSADLLAVYSERLRDTYEKLGFPRERLAVTGNPEWDVYTRAPMPGHRDYIARTLGLDVAKTTIVYAITYANPLSPSSLMHAGYVERTTEAVVEAFAALAEQHADWQFVLRPHPNDPDAPRALRELADAKGLKQVWIDNLTSAVSCLSIADALVCTHSNMGVEAIIAGKPVVNCVLDAYCKEVFEEGVGPLFLEEDAVLTIRQKDGIANAIERVLLDPDEQARFLAGRPDTIRRFNGPNDGRAMERVCALVTGMLDNERPVVPPNTRYPEFEQVFMRLLPKAAKRVLVLGHAGVHVATAVLSSAPHLHVDAFPEWPADALKADVVLLSDPLPHAAEAVDLLARALEHAGTEGSVIVAFRHGGNADAWETLSSGKWAPPHPGAESALPVDEYSWPGVEALLASVGLKTSACQALLNATAGEAFIAEGPVVRPGDGYFQERLGVEAWVVRAERQT